MSLLPQSFYRRDAREVARELLGKRLRHGPVVLEITEVEAYVWPDDSACHNRFGKTERTAVMFGPPGRAYVYLCYGLHQMLNVVTNEVDEGAAVLIRSCAPVDGLDEIEARRGGKRGPVLLTGPGKVGQALGVDTSFSGHPLYRRGGLEVHDGPAPAAILAGKRVGIDYARPEHRDAPWRYAIADSPWVSQRAGLG